MKGGECKKIQNKVKKSTSFHLNRSLVLSNDRGYICSILTLFQVYHEASLSLPQLDGEPTRFRDLLLRMSVQDSSASSKSVLYALFCLAALKRYGNVQESNHFKDLALQSLQQAARDEGIGPAHILQHMAAVLLLCRAEISLGDDSGVFWALYICSLRTVSGVAFDGQLGNGFYSEDANILYHYLHYHDILAQFSLSHWLRPAQTMRQLKLKFKTQELTFKCKGYLDRVCFAELQLRTILYFNPPHISNASSSSTPRKNLMAIYITRSTFCRESSRLPSRNSWTPTTQLKTTTWKVSRSWRKSSRRLYQTAKWLAAAFLLSTRKMHRLLQAPA